MLRYRRKPDEAETPAEEEKPFLEKESVSLSRKKRGLCSFFSRTCPTTVKKNKSVMDLSFIKKEDHYEICFNSVSFLIVFPRGEIIASVGEHHVMNEQLLMSIVEEQDFPETLTLRDKTVKVVEGEWKGNACLAIETEVEEDDSVVTSLLELTPESFMALLKFYYPDVEAIQSSAEKCIELIKQEIFYRERNPMLSFVCEGSSGF